MRTPWSFDPDAPAGAQALVLARLVHAGAVSAEEADDAICLLEFIVETGHDQHFVDLLRKTIDRHTGKAAFMEAVADARNVHVRTRRGDHVMIHPSVRGDAPGTWQITRFAVDGSELVPIGHRNTTRGIHGALEDVWNAQGPLELVARANPPNWGEQWFFEGVHDLVSAVRHTEPGFRQHVAEKLEPADSDALEGVRVRWLKHSAHVVMVPVEKVQFTDTNPFNLEYAAAILDTIERGLNPVFRLPAGRVYRITEEDVAESRAEYEQRDLLYQRNMEKPWGPEDVGTLHAYLIDGNHRALAAMAAGEKFIFVSVSPNYVQDVAENEWQTNPPEISFANWHTGCDGAHNRYTLYALTAEGHEELRHGILDYPTRAMLLGEVHYSVFLSSTGNTVLIHWIGVPETQRRKGVGTALWRELERLWPGASFPSTGLTDQGEALRRSVGRNPPPGDAGLRELGRAASSGDQYAQDALYRARTRAGKCAECELTLPWGPVPGGSVVPVSTDKSGLKRCIACAAVAELEEVARWHDPVGGYLTVLPRPIAGRGWANIWDVPGRGPNFAIVNFMGFPLIAVTAIVVSRAGFTGMAHRWRGVDRDGRMWLGRSTGLEMNTTARRKKRGRDERSGGWPGQMIDATVPALGRAQNEWIRLALLDPTGAALDASRVQANEAEAHAAEQDRLEAEHEDQGPHWDAEGEWIGPGEGPRPECSVCGMYTSSGLTNNEGEPVCYEHHEPDLLAVDIDEYEEGYPAASWEDYEENPPTGDERIRRLERLASQGDHDAALRLGHERTRAGMCATCGVTLPAAPEGGGGVPVASTEDGRRRCIACASELDLVLVRARRPVAGYLSRVTHPVEGWPVTAQNTYAVTNFMGFPLLAVTRLLGITSAYTGRSLAYSAVDVDQQAWFGRSSAVGYVTTAMPKKQGDEPWLLRGRKSLAEAQATWLRLAREDPSGALLNS